MRRAFRNLYGVMLVVLALAGCTIDYPVDKLDHPMSVMTARSVILGLAKPGHGYFFYLDSDESNRLNTPRIFLEPDAVRFGSTKIPLLQIQEITGVGNVTNGYLLLKVDLAGQRHVAHIKQNTDVEYQLPDWLASAFWILKAEAGRHPEEQAAFEKAAADYRAANPKPAPTEALRQREVQAEALVQGKKFLEAAETYQRALNEAPWWPQGHFNLAMVLESLGDYGLAVEEMQRYLTLVPDAPNARAAQDKIYEWQAMGGAAN